MDNKIPITEIVKEVCPAVITIAVLRDLPEIEGFYNLPGIAIPKVKGSKKIETKIGGGSGFIVSKEGFILTSAHVVTDPEASYSVILEPDIKYSAKILSRDLINDIAVLKIDGDDFPFLKLGDSSQIKLGEQVIAVGNPLGEFYDTVSAGIISGLSRLINARSEFSEKSTRLKGLIQTDAAINPGNSGGPLINMRGEVIGLNTAMVMGSQNLGFAIPINYAKKDLEEVITYGRVKIPFLGIKYIILNKEMASQNKLAVSFGALIIRERLGEEAVVPGSAAAKAGLKEFDIITEVDKVPINEENYLSDILDKYKIGDTIDLTVVRGKKKSEISLKLEEKI
jgi:S1-C subfamily serine protease